MNPPFKITEKILNLCLEISHLIGQYEGLRFPKPQIKLRKENRIRSIHSTLMIEGNRLTKAQVSAILEGQRVVGPLKDIKEVKDAIQVYDQLTRYNPKSESHFKEAHKVLLDGLAKDAGKYRSGNVGVFDGSPATHVAPKYIFVPQLMGNLFTFLKQSKSHPLIVSSVFHYEMAFIHPFSDGNGRLGRLWQTVILCEWNPVFEFIPIESVIKENQEAYYQALNQSDKSGESTLFIEFILDAILKATTEFLDQLKPEPVTSANRLTLFCEHIQKEPFTRKTYLQFFKSLSTATASRDLAMGVQEGKLRKIGEKITTTYSVL